MQALWTSACHQKLTCKVEEKLGIGKGVMTAGDIGGLWKLCGQQLALQSKADEACNLFSDEVGQALAEAKGKRIWEKAFFSLFWPA